jgi:hypothetical protein
MTLRYWEASMTRSARSQARGRHGAKWGEFISVDVTAEELPDLRSWSATSSGEAEIICRKAVNC